MSSKKESTKKKNEQIDVDETNRQNSQTKDNGSIKSGSKKNDCALFLQKTFCMINKCEPGIIEWSDDGKYFVIKDPEVLASTVIPRFFKHNNLPSFIRQLHHYGFRKIKTEHVIVEPGTEQTSRYSFFQHELFIRGRPELLLQIQKPSHQTRPISQQIEEVKTEVEDLKNIIKNMEAKVENLHFVARGLASRLEKNLKRELTAIGDFNCRQKKRKSLSSIYSPAPTVLSQPTIRSYERNINSSEKFSAVDLQNFSSSVSVSSLSLNNRCTVSTFQKKNTQRPDSFEKLDPSNNSNIHNMMKEVRTMKETHILNTSNQNNREHNFQTQSTLDHQQSYQMAISEKSPTPSPSFKDQNNVKDNVSNDDKMFHEQVGKISNVWRSSRKSKPNTFINEEYDDEIVKTLLDSD